MTPVSQEKQSVTRSAAAMAFGTSTSRVLGLVRELCLAALFPRTITDAWNVAFRLPNMFRRLFGEGSLSVTFVPIFLDELKKDPAQARRFVNGVATLLFSMTLTLITLGLIFMEEIIGFLTLGEGYQSVPGKVDLTVRMARIMFGYLFLVTAYAYFMAILNALKQFALPAMAPTVFNFFFVLSTLVPDRFAPFSGGFLAWGVILGGFFQMAMLIPALVRAGFLPRLRFDLQLPSIRLFLRNLVPSLIGMGILQITTIINTQFASHLEEGTQSWIAWADRVLELPLSIIAVSLGSALLPTLSSFARDGMKDEMNDTAHSYWKLLFYLSLPCAVGMYFLAQPIVEVLFQRGHFGPRDTEMTSMILQVYAPLMIATAGVRVLSPSFYAIKNTWIPAVVGFICLVVHYFVAQVLMDRYGLKGLASSLAVSGSLNLILLVVFYHVMIARIHLASLLKSFFISTLASFALALALQSYHPIRGMLDAGLAEIRFSRSISATLSLAITMAIGALVFFGISVLLKIPEFQMLLRARRRRSKGS